MKKNTPTTKPKTNPKSPTLPKPVRDYLSAIGKRGGKSRMAVLSDEEHLAMSRRGGEVGGKEGGPARAKALTAKRRSEIARKAVEARWAKARKTAEGTEPGAG